SSETDTIETTIDLGARCTDLDLSDDALWIVCLPEDLVLRVDPDRGEVTDRIEGLDRPQSISVAADVWVAYKGHLARIDPKTSTVSAAVVTTPGAVDGLFATDDRVWLRSHGRFLRTLDADTLAVVEEINAPEQSGGDVVAAFGSVWASAFDDAVVYRLRW
ncbi:MAG TPA: hypothetical protein VGR26_13930, partial [Acidimicrobiales bacterium]|nr:hypothetical protein [Acidimicrobiales bacterium]